MSLRTFFLIVIYIAVAVAGLKAYAGPTLVEALRSTSVLRVAAPLEHFGSRREQGPKATYASNANVGNILAKEARCYFGFSYRVGAKDADLIFQDVDGVIPSKSKKWVGYRELPSLDPLYFFQALYLNPKIELQIQPFDSPKPMPIYPCLEWRTDYYDNGYSEMKCIRQADTPSNYAYSIYWNMKFGASSDVTYQGSCQKYNPVAADAVITLEEFNAVTNGAFKF